MSQTTAPTRDFDVVLFGATGFTGRLVAEYLSHLSEDRRPSWAIAGRNQDKLKALAESLSLDVPILIADSHDRPSLDAIAERTKVVCTTVGPFAKHGTELVAACAEAGVDYCDITGETPWIREMITRFHETARRTGARIVPCCGMDSIPSDLGTLLLAEHFEAEGTKLASVRCRVKRLRGKPSGGTATSLLGVLAQARDRAARRELLDPYALCPPAPGRPRLGNDLLPKKEGDRFAGPFVMALINSRVVHRSNALMDDRYGRDFRYSEAFDTGRGPKGALRAVVSSAGLGGFAVAGALAPGLVGRVLPDPGEGPNEAEREAGCFELRLMGTSRDGRDAVAVVAGERDPGYAETSKMLSEAALCLAKDDLDAQGGLLTPASAMGRTLIERLRAAGMTLTVSS